MEINELISFSTELSAAAVSGDWLRYRSLKPAMILGSSLNVCLNDDLLLNCLYRCVCVCVS